MPPSGRITAIRVQDIPRDIWYNWDIGVPGHGWTTTGPVGPGPGEGGVTPGSNTLYIAFYVVNNGSTAGVLTLRIVDASTGFVRNQISVSVAVGAGAGIEWTGNMPTSNYIVRCEVTP